MFFLAIAGIAFYHFVLPDGFLFTLCACQPTISEIVTSFNMLTCNFATFSYHFSISQLIASWDFGPSFPITPPPHFYLLAALYLFVQWMSLTSNWIFLHVFPPSATLHRLSSWRFRLPPYAAFWMRERSRCFLTILNIRCTLRLNNINTLNCKALRSFFCNSTLLPVLKSHSDISFLGCSAIEF